MKKCYTAVVTTAQVQTPLLPSHPIKLLLLLTIPVGQLGRPTKDVSDAAVCSITQFNSAM